MNEQDENRLDDFLRNKLGDYRPEPRPEVWAAVANRVNKPVAPTQRRFGRWMPVLLSGTVGLLVGWLAEPQFQTNNQSITPNPPAAVVEIPVAAPPVVAPAGNGGFVASQSQASVATPSGVATGPLVAEGDVMTASAPTEAPVAAPSAPVANQAAGELLPAMAVVPGAAGTPAAPALTAPVAGAPVVAVVFATPPPVRLTPPALEGLVAAEHHVQLALLDTALSANTRRVMALQLEKAELASLQRRVDSLIRVLDPEAALAAAPDSVLRQPPVPTHRWSVMAAFAPEHTFMGLQGPVGDTMTVLRRNHEEGRGSFNAALMGEYRVSNRLSVGMGIGFSTYGASLRVTNRNTQFDVRNDTTTSIVTDTYISTNTVVGTHLDTVYYYVPSPVYNSSGQVVSFDSVRSYKLQTYNDTTRLTTTEVVQSIKQTITPQLIKHETTTYKVLKPDYRFVTIPVLVRYRLSPEVKGTRWWTDVAMGAQFQFFQGGTQLVTADGRTFFTQRVKPSEAPFRPLNVALTGQLAFNYALTSHLSMSVAPAVRWQVQSVYKKETGLKQQPTTTGLQLAARWAF